jgi:transcriptional regulator with XRE-family HTH domain
MGAENQLKTLRLLMKRRIDAGEFTEAELARMVDLKQSTISNFVNGRRGAKPSTMDRYKVALGIRDEDLLESQPTLLPSADEKIPVVRHITAITAPFISSDLVLRNSGLSVASFRHLRCKPRLDREAWTRFVAIVITRKQMRFLEPIFSDGAMLFIDRHDQRLDVETQGTAELYAVNNGGFLGIGYLEPNGENLLLKSNHPGKRTMRIAVSNKKSAVYFIIGRICHVSMDIGTSHQ